VTASPQTVLHSVKAQHLRCVFVQNRSLAYRKDISVLFTQKFTNILVTDCCLLTYFIYQLLHIYIRNAMFRWKIPTNGSWFLCLGNTTFHSGTNMQDGVILDPEECMLSGQLVLLTVTKYSCNATLLALSIPSCVHCQKIMNY